MSWLLALLLSANLAAASDEEEVKFVSVTVRAGDTLWNISQTYLKDPQLWGELLKYNKLPNSDPTIALPGMVLRVPVAILRFPTAGLLIYLKNRVFYRPRASAEWRAAQPAEKLHRDDGVRTGENSRARIRFATGRELSLEPDSLAVIGPPAETLRDAVLDLRSGALKAVRVTVRTAAARIVPKGQDAAYDAEVLPDLSTEVSVYSGAAQIEGGGKSVEVPSGYSVNVVPGGAPSAPQRTRVAAPSPAEAPQAPADTRLKTDSGDLRVQLGSLRLGVPVSGYRVQVAETEDFRLVLLDRTFDAEDRIELRSAQLDPGRYWVRTAAIDLLGEQGRFSAAQRMAISP
jgi:hypothetical protein